MFTGIITDIGTIGAVDGGRITIRCAYAADTIAAGASIACDGCCLTATEIEAANNGGCAFSADVSNETLGATTLGRWSVGRKVNLERSLSLKDELGGHIVAGHVDAVAAIAARENDGESVRFWIDIPQGFAHLIAGKGSVALDGVSLTVNEIADARFGINIVPHTLEHTTWGAKQAGDMVNLEVDLLARYVARISEVLKAGDSWR